MEGEGNVGEVSVEDKLGRLDVLLRGEISRLCRATWEYRRQDTRGMTTVTSKVAMSMTLRCVREGDCKALSGRCRQLTLILEQTGLT